MPSHGRTTVETGSTNSHVDVYVDLIVRLVGHDPLGITASKNRQHDLETCRSRVHGEGLSFLTKSLPSLGKALDQGLITGRFSLPRGWKHQRWCRSRPAFLQAYINLLFDECGDLLDDADPAAVSHLRQVCFAMYKLDLPYSVSVENGVIQSFIDTDVGLELDLNDSPTLTLVRAMSVIASDVLEGFNPKEIIPGHGPGAVATGERLDAKWSFGRLYNGIHQQFPYYDYFIIGGARELTDRLDWYNALERRESGVAKVVLVPKDSRGPRLISAEPLEYQWIQQGLGRKLVAHLESSRITSGCINFTHQSVNRDLAFSSSNTGKFATLDLKDASDRVSLALVQAVFSDIPDFLASIEAVRSTATKLPDGRIVQLKKFAPMGSAICFPVEALIFWLACVAAVHSHFVHLSRDSPERRAYAIAMSDVRKIGRCVFVYGDDIVVPTDWAHICIQGLERVGLLVNRSKSCISGLFRESCGMDAFKGVDVTPTRIKTQWTGRPSDGAALASFVSLGNAFASKGYDDASSSIKSRVETTYGKIPYGTSRASYPCWEVSNPWTATVRNRGSFKMRFSSTYHRVEFLVPKIAPRKQDSTLDSWPRLLRNGVTEELLEPSKIVVPRSIRIKRGWAAVS